MDSILKSDIFFFITSLAVVIITLIFTVILFYVIRLIKHVEYIAEKVKLESDNVSKDIEDFREKFKEGSMKLGNLFGTFAGFAAKNFGASMMNAFKNKTAGTRQKRSSTSSSSKAKKSSQESEENDSYDL